MNVIKALVARLRRTDDMVEAPAFRNVESRIVKVLIEIGRERGTKEGGSYRVRKMTHRELASRVGSSREAVTKALKALTFKRLIEERGNFWLIPEDAEGRHRPLREPVENLPYPAEDPFLGKGR